MKLEDSVVVFMAGLAKNILEREGNGGKVTRIECTTTVSPKPFTIEVRAVGQYNTTCIVGYIFVVWCVVPPRADSSSSATLLTAAEYSALLVLYVPRSAVLLSI